MDNLLEFLFGRDVPGQLNILAQTLLPAIWETVYSTLLATLLAYLIGLPLGVLLVVGEPGGIRPLPRPVMKTLNILVNILRSVPFLILMIMVIPLSRLILGTSVGTVALLVPLVIAAFPFVSRLVEGSLRDADGGVIEAAPPAASSGRCCCLSACPPSSPASPPPSSPSWATAPWRVCWGAAGWAPWPSTMAITANKPSSCTPR